MGGVKNNSDGVIRRMKGQRKKKDSKQTFDCRWSQLVIV